MGNNYQINRYKGDIVFRKVALSMMGKPDELLENPALANTYTNEEILVKFARSRAMSVYTYDDVLE